MTPTLFAVIGLVLTVLVQFGGIVTFAVTMRSAVTQLTKTTGKLESAVERLDQRFGDLDGRLRVVEDRQARVVP